MSWYYVDSSGATQGPLSVAALKGKYGKDMTDGSYVWNGADVNQWTPLSNVPQLLKQLKPPSGGGAVPGPPRGGPPGGPRKKKLGGGGGGGKANLLAGIRAGTKLKKVQTNDRSAVRGAKGNEGMGGAPKPRGKMSLQEQMAQAMARRRKGGGIKKSVSPARKTGNPGGPSAPSKAPAKKWGASKAPAKKWGPVGGSKGPSKGPAKKWGSNNSSSASGGGTGNARTDKIVTKLKNAQEWQLKAIEKILS